MRIDLLSRTLFRFFRLPVRLPCPALTRACVLMGTVLCALLLCPPAAQAQSVIHVTEDGDAAADGSSWGSATTLQNALDTARP